MILLHEDIVASRTNTNISLYHEDRTLEPTITFHRGSKEVKAPTTEEYKASSWSYLSIGTTKIMFNDPPGKSLAGYKPEAIHRSFPMSWDMADFFSATPFSQFKGGWPYPIFLYGSSSPAYLLVPYRCSCRCSLQTPYIYLESIIHLLAWWLVCSLRC